MMHTDDLADGEKRPTVMTESEKHIAHLFTAELQFRLASTVRLATGSGVQPLEFPLEWTHGKYGVEHAEIALRPGQADYAAYFLLLSATFLMAVAIKESIEAVVKKPTISSDSEVWSAYQIARLIRNSFTHAPFFPRWRISHDCKHRIFEIPGIITFNTEGLQGKVFDWRDYGGPLALFRLCRFVRIEILKDQPTPRKSVPVPGNIAYQTGNLILRKVGEIPEDAVRTKVERLRDGSVNIGGEVRLPAKGKDDRS